MNRAIPPGREADDPIPLDLLDMTEPGDVSFDLADEVVPVVCEETGVELVQEEKALEVVPGQETARVERKTALGRLPRRPEEVIGLRVVREEDWCKVCGTRHETGECPGELLATGPERHGWRGTYETPRGTRETHAILIAPASGRWRARIMTYPRALWTLPSCPRTIKFLADLPGEAEKLARALVEEHCRDRQCKRVSEELSKLEISSFDREQLASLSEEEAARRRPRVLPIKYGIYGQPLDKSSTADLSETGVFIATDAGIAVGTLLRMVLELPAASVPLRGTVRWTRVCSAPGRPAGVGVELSRSPALYLHYVRSLP